MTYITNNRALLKNNEGFQLIGVIAACTVLIISLVASLKAYLDISYLISQSRERTTAVIQIGNIFEEIESWSDINCNAITGTDWKDWLENTLGVDLLPSEQVSLAAQNLFPEDESELVEATATINWVDSRGHPKTITLIEGFTQNAT